MNVFIVYLAFFLVISALFLGLWRMFKGPTVPDRVVAADTLVVISTACLVWLASEFDNPIFLDIALVYGALAFVGVVAIARAIEGSSSSK